MLEYVELALSTIKVSPLPIQAKFKVVYSMVSVGFWSKSSSVLFIQAFKFFISLSVILKAMRWY